MDHFQQTLDHLLEKSADVSTQAAGQLVRVVGLTLEARGLSSPLGSLCEVETKDGWLPAEVIGFDGDLLFLMPVEEMRGVLPGAGVRPLQRQQELKIGEGLLGRILDGNGVPMDTLGRLTKTHATDRNYTVINPLSRQKICDPLDVGVRTINSLFTIGKGQRMGLFAQSGVGKSVLLGMMTKGTKADVVVVCLVGERGREVKEFIEESLGQEGLARAVVVTSPADTSPLMRLRSCETASLIAEFFRNEGKDVLLLMDSLTRYSQAQREVALAAVSRLQPKAIRHLFLLNYRNWSNARGKVSMAKVRLPRFIQCSSKVMYVLIRLLMQQGRYSMVIFI